MSFLQCPMCGKHTTLDSFDPSGFDDDVYVRSCVGLGRGKGFQWSPPVSVLGDGAVTPLVAERTLDLLAMLVKANCLKTTDVLKRLGFKNVVPREAVKEKDRLITDLGKETLSLKESLGKLQKGFQERGAMIEALGGQVVNLKEENARLKATVKQKDRLLEDAGQEILSLKSKVKALREKLEHRTEQAKKLYRICKSQKQKIQQQADLLEDLGEEMLEGTRYG